MSTTQTRRKAALVIYPGFTLLDLVGPLSVFSSLDCLDILFVAETMAPVPVGSVSIQPTCAFDDCPQDLRLLFVPGGTSGTVAAMADPALLGFLKSRGARADFVTSVCTGSLLLGAAGLLQGFRATTHWLALDALALLGAEPVKARVVIDRNRVTGAGVTSGIDFGLTLAARLADEETARRIQLALEYDPQPPFAAGSPDLAPATAARVREMFVVFSESACAAAEQARRRW